MTGFALKPPTVPSNFAASGARELLAAHYENDIRDAEKLRGALNAAKPDVIFHMAAQAIVRESYAYPRETFDVNVMGTVCLLDAVRTLEHPCAIIVVTSDKCYEDRGQASGYRECDPMGGHDPYSASKGAAELAVASYRRSFFPPDRASDHGVKLASARAGNVIGGGDWGKDRIIADAVRALSAGKAAPVRNPNFTRPWQHALEPLSGYLTLAARMLSSDDPALCDGWNFGPYPETEATVARLMELFCDAWGGGAWKETPEPAAPREAGVLRLSIDKATRLLGWRPCWRLEESVRRAARWYRMFYEDTTAGMRQACLEDIAAYEDAMSQ